jgi:hypothetical protein
MLIIAHQRLILIYVYFSLILNFYLFLDFNNLDFISISFTITSIRMDKKLKKVEIPDLTEFQKEVIFGSMLGDLSAERSHINEIPDYVFMCLFKIKT